MTPKKLWTLLFPIYEPSAKPFSESENPFSEAFLEAFIVAWPRKRAPNLGCNSRGGHGVKALRNYTFFIQIQCLLL